LVVLLEEYYLTVINTGLEKAKQCPAYRDNNHGKGEYRFICLIKNNVNTISGFFKRCSRCHIGEDEKTLRTSIILLAKKK
jgi:hypothetical protein